jgi:serine/threonine protein kinase
MLQAIECAHSKGLAHRDLKPENILLNNYFSCKIADFGFAKKISGPEGKGYLKSRLGTEAYMAPE